MPGKKSVLTTAVARKVYRVCHGQIRGLLGKDGYSREHSTVHRFPACYSFERFWKFESRESGNGSHLDGPRVFSRSALACLRFSLRDTSCCLGNRGGRSEGKEKKERRAAGIGHSHRHSHVRRTANRLHDFRPAGCVADWRHRTPPPNLRG